MQPCTRHLRRVGHLKIFMTFSMACATPCRRCVELQLTSSITHCFAVLAESGVRGSAHPESQTSSDACTKELYTRPGSRPTGVRDSLPMLKDWSGPCHLQSRQLHEPRGAHALRRAQGGPHEQQAFDKWKNAASWGADAATCTSNLLSTTLARDHLARTWAAAPPHAPGQLHGDMSEPDECMAA